MPQITSYLNLEGQPISQTDWHRLHLDLGRHLKNAKPYLEYEFPDGTKVAAEFVGLEFDNHDKQVFVVERRSAPDAPSGALTPHEYVADPKLLTDTFNRFIDEYAAATRKDA